MSIFHYGSKSDLAREELLRRSREKLWEEFFQKENAGKATPYSAPDYLPLWTTIREIAKFSDDLRTKIAQLEDANPETNQELKKQLLLIQATVNKALVLAGEGKCCLLRDLHKKLKNGKIWVDF